MSDLVVISFPTEAKAEEVRQKLLGMQKEYLLELGDAVVAAKDAKGNIKLNQMINTTAAGAVGADLRRPRRAGERRHHAPRDGRLSARAATSPAGV